MERYLALVVCHIQISGTVLGTMSEPSRLIVFYLTTTITTDLIIIHSIHIHFALKLIKIIVEIKAIIYVIQNSDSTKERV